MHSYTFGARHFSFQPVLHNWSNKGYGMCCPVCGMVHIKNLLLIRRSSPCGSSCFLFLQSGVRCSSVVRAFAHGAMGHRIDPSWVDPLSYFSCQPVLHDYVLSCLWDGAYKRTLAVNRKE